MADAGYALLPSLMFLAGCPTAKPDANHIATIEMRLASDPCLKNFSEMRREYRLAKRGWKIDPNRIEVSVYLSGHDGLPGGSYAQSVDRRTIIDDRDYFSAAATYVIDRDALNLWHCGMRF